MHGCMRPSRVDLPPHPAGRQLPIRDPLPNRPSAMRKVPCRENGDRGSHLKNQCGVKAARKAPGVRALSWFVLLQDPQVTLVTNARHRFPSMLRSCS